MTDFLPDRIRQIMADVFGIKPDAIPDNAAIGVLEQWDSGNHISLVLALEEEFGVSFDVPEIEAMTCFKDVVGGVERKL